jgi:aminoglycoside phosphotransferase (APT) family kinase protein
MSLEALDVPRANAAKEFDPGDPALQCRLASWLTAQWDAPVKVSSWQRFHGGLSWVTIGFTATVNEIDRRLILRLGDPAGLFSPYRTEPEYLALTALIAVRNLPIPEALLCCDDESVLGAPFVITTRVDGDAPEPWSEESAWTEAERLSLAAEFSSTLGILHAFDWSRSPLSVWAEGLTPRNTAVAQTRRWAQHCGYPQVPLPPAMHHAMRWLEARAPEAEQIVVVHGDYRVGNFLRDGGHISAVLDWEMVHLGDAHEDLAWAALRAFSPPKATRIGGLVDRDEFHRRYREGRPRQAALLRRLR